jgi:hypothetical protein
MKKTRKKPILFLLALLAPLLISGQVKQIPASISLFNESTAIPFTRLFTTPVHPGIQIGTEFDYTRKSHSRFFQTANLSYFYHNYLSQGIAIHSEVGYEYRMAYGFSVTGLFGLGYMHTFATGEEFTFSGGQYARKTDKGNSRLFPSLSFDLGYYLHPAIANSPRVFLRYQAWAEYPYSPDFIPVLTHINLHVGMKFFITSKSISHE